MIAVSNTYHMSTQQQQPTKPAKARRERKKKEAKKAAVKPSRGKAVRKETRAAIKALPQNEQRYFGRIFSKQDAARFAWMKTVADPFGNIHSPIPPILAPGASTSSPRMYSVTLRGVAVANSVGCVYVGANADAWLPNSGKAAGTIAEPMFQYLGNSSTNGGFRGFPVHYTTQGYLGSVAAIGTNSTGRSYPSPALAASSAVAGVQFIQLPDQFINTQLNNNPASGNAYQRYANVAVGLRVRPLAPTPGSLLMAGNLMMVQQILGDTVQTNPAAANSSGTVGGIDCYAYVSGMTDELGGVAVVRNAPLSKEMVGRSELSVPEWPREGKSHAWLTGSAIPNQSCCFGMWVPAQSGCQLVGYPQIAAIGAGFEQGQSIEFEAAYIYAFYGSVSYETTDKKLPTPVGLQDLHGTAAAAAAHMNIEAPHASKPGRTALLSTVQPHVDNGDVPKGSASKFVSAGKDVIEAATGSSIGDLVGEGLGFLAAALL
jgi:hypothetical protein